jgi:hypothetical protein
MSYNVVDPENQHAVCGVLREGWGSQDDDYEEWCLLACDAYVSGEHAISIFKVEQ